MSRSGCTLATGIQVQTQFQGVQSSCWGLVAEAFDILNFISLRLRQVWMRIAFRCFGVLTSGCFGVTVPAPKPKTCGSLCGL